MGDIDLGRSGTIVNGKFSCVLVVWRVRCVNPTCSSLNNYYDIKESDHHLLRCEVCKYNFQKSRAEMREACNVTVVTNKGKVKVPLEFQPNVPGDQFAEYFTGNRFDASFINGIMCNIEFPQQA